MTAKIKSYGAYAAAVMLLAGSLAAAAPDARAGVGVVDSLGRRVQVPARVERIACLYAFTGHVVALLGRGNDIVAVSRGLKRDVLLNRICPEIRKAVVPKAQGGINVEELLMARPDVVFLPGDIGRSRAEMDKLAAFGIPAIVIEYQTIDAQMRAIEAIGSAVGKPGRAEDYLRTLRQCLARVEAAAASIPADRRVRAYHATVEATRTYGGGTLAAELLRRCGIINVAADQPLSFHQGEQHAGIEQILLWNPDMIFVNDPSAAEHILEDPRWSTLTAVSDKKVYQMPIGISRWGHPGSLETPLALLWLAKTAYPDCLADTDLQAETKRFYRTYFGLDLDDKMVERIMSGKGMRTPKGRRPSGNRKGADR